MVLPSIEFLNASSSSLSWSLAGRMMSLKNTCVLFSGAAVWPGSGGGLRAYSKMVCQNLSATNHTVSRETSKHSRAQPWMWRGAL